MSEINTFAALKAGGPLEPWQYVPRELGENDVRLEIECCGICHSDIHRIDNGWSASPTTYPFVGGHEIVGKVVQKGKNVAIEIGTRVGVGPQSGACFECETCKAGRENYCPKKFFTYNSKDYTGHQTYGGYADAIVVDYRFAFEIPESLESTAAAPLLCAGLTVYAPLAEFDVKGKRVGVLSCGGLGHMAIQIAKHMNAAEVVVISTSENKKDLAMKLGATKFVVSTDPKQMKECEGSLDFLLSCAAFDLDWNGLLKLLAEHGMLHCVGVPEEEFHVNLFHLIGQRRRIGGSLIGNRQQMKDMLNFCAENKILAMISEVGDMKDATKHVETCRQGKAKFRIVLKN